MNGRAVKSSRGKGCGGGGGGVYVAERACACGWVGAKVATGRRLLCCARVLRQSNAHATNMTAEPWLFWLCLAELHTHALRCVRHRLVVDGSQIIVPVLRPLRRRRIAR